MIKYKITLLFFFFSIFNTNFLYPADNKVKVDLLFSDDTVFVGEKPVVVVRLNNNGAEPVSVIKDERHAFYRLAYTFGMIQDKVDRGPHNKQERRAWKRPDDYVFLDPGHTKIYKFTSVDYPRKSGKYILRFHFTPFANDSTEIKGEAAISAKDLLDRDIVAKHRINYSGAKGQEFIDFINIKTENGYELIFRRTSNTAGCLCVKRLAGIGSDTRFLATPLVSRTRNSRDNIIFTFNLRQTLFVLRIDINGSILEKNKISMTKENLVLKKVK